MKPTPEQWQRLADALDAYDGIDAEHPPFMNPELLELLESAREVLEAHDEFVLEEHEATKSAQRG